MLACCLMAASGMLAQSAAAIPADLKEKPAQYLENAAGTVAALPPESQAPALLQLATVERAVDPKKALERLEQAFAATAALPSVKDNRLREQTQAMIVREMANGDLEKALEKLSAMDGTPADELDPRAEATEQIVAGLVRRKKLEEAAQVMERFGSSGAYSYGGARALLAALPAEDDRRAPIFGQVVAAFQRQPDLDAMAPVVRGFGPWSTKPMPKTLFDAAVRSMVAAALENKGILTPGTITVTTEKGTIALSDPQDSQLWRLVDLAAAVDADLVRKMTQERPQLARLVAVFPEGMRSLDKGAGVVTTGTLVGANPNSAEAQAKQQRLVQETARFQEVMKYYREDPDRALAASRGIPTAILRVRAITTVARNVDEKQPGAARPVIEKCMAALEEMKPPESRASGWSGIAMAAARIQDKELAVKALSKGVVDLQAQYAKDADPENPNGAPRPMWPSTVAFKALFFQAAKLLGAEVEGFLEKIQDPEIQTLARIDIAGAWLGVEPAPIPIRTYKKPK